jgi:hypothetical protein
MKEFVQRLLRQALNWRFQDFRAERLLMRGGFIRDLGQELDDVEMVSLKFIVVDHDI